MQPPVDSRLGGGAETSDTGAAGCSTHTDTSARRLLARPARVLFSATGRLAPNPSIAKASCGSPRALCRYRTTLAALASDRRWLVTKRRFASLTRRCESV